MPHATITSYGVKWGDEPPGITLRATAYDLPDPGAGSAARGTDATLAAAVLKSPKARKRVFRIAEAAVDGDHIGVCCVAGHHRSPAIVEAVAAYLRARGWTVTVTHRHLTRVDTGPKVTRPLRADLPIEPGRSRSGLRPRTWGDYHRGAGR